MRQKPQYLEMFALCLVCWTFHNLPREILFLHIRITCKCNVMGGNDIKRKAISGEWKTRKSDVTRKNGIIRADENLRRNKANNVAGATKFAIICWRDRINSVPSSIGTTARMYPKLKARINPFSATAEYNISSLSDRQFVPSSWVFATLVPFADPPFIRIGTFG